MKLTPIVFAVAACAAAIAMAVTAPGHSHAITTYASR